MASRIYESSIIAQPIGVLWDAIRTLDFKWLPDMKSAGSMKAGVVGATRELTYKDGTVQTIRVSEISDQNHSVSYEVIASVPAISYLSVAHTFRLHRVTTSDRASTFVEIISDYSRDASREVTADSSFKKKDIFEALARLDAKSVPVSGSGGSGAVDTKSDGKSSDPIAQANAYRVETMRTVYDRLRKGGFVGMSEEQFLASPPVQKLLNRSQTSIETFQSRLVADYPGAHKQYDNPLRFDLSAKQMVGLTQELMLYTTAAMDAVAATKTSGVAPTWATVCQPLATAERVCSALDSMVTFPKDVFEQKELRDVSAEQATVLADFYVAAGMREDVFLAVSAYAETKEAKELRGEQKRFLQHTLRDFKRNGLALEKKIRDEVKALQSAMAASSIKFAQNLGEEDTKFEFSADELAGVPQPLLAQFKKSESGDKYIVTIRYPDYFPVMKLCSVEATRQKLERAFTSRCKDSNSVILNDLVTKRAKLAKLLGFDTFAAYILDVRMAKTPKAVDTFLTDLVQKVKPLLQNEQKALLKLKAADKLERKLTNVDDTVLNMWDLAFYSRIREEKEFAVNQQEIKQYFPLETVTKGLLDIYQRLLGLTFKEKTGGCHGWHKSVTLFEVNDTKSGKEVGHFYLDLFPRPGKFGHAACFPLQAGCVIDSKTGARQLPIAACVCNFAAPTGDQPSLLLHSEVVTFFHEFGHVMHHLCSETELAHFAGTSVERDFVEAPSQMLENWCYQPEVMALMSSHIKDGSKLPEATLKRMVAAKDSSTGMFNTRQIVFGQFDQHLHTGSGSGSGGDSKAAAAVVDAGALFAKTWNDLMGLSVTPGTDFSASFGHIAGGYEAQYYGYLWSEVFSMDMFISVFKTGNKLLDPASGMNYRKKILAVGSSRDAMDSLVDFLGRKPNAEAFLKSKGL